MKLHPDKCSLEGSEDAFKKIGEAFGVLSDKSKKEDYDRYGTKDNDSSRNSTGGVRFNGAGMNPDILRELFRQANRGGGGGFRGGPGMHFQFPGGFATTRGGPTQINASQFLPVQIYQAIASVIPPPLLLILFFVLLAVFLSAFMNFMMSMGHFLLFVVYFVPSKLKMPVIALLFVSYFLGGIF